MSARLVANLKTKGGQLVMRAEDFKPDDLFTQIQNLVERLAVERRAREAAAAADKAKSELLATVGHELKAPADTLIAVIELLSASPLDPAQRRYTDMLAQSALSLRDVLDDIFDLTRLEAGRFALDRSEFDLHAMMQDVGSVLQARANDKGLTSGIDIGASCPQIVVANEARIRQVLMSLIDTALKSTVDGSVRLHASGIEVNGVWRLRFDVSDTGSGHSRAERYQLFKPMLKFPSATIAQRGPTGLELAIGRKLAALMGGEVGCDSAVGKGSLYWFTLAAERAGPEPLEAEPPVLVLLEDEAVAAKPVKETEPQGKLRGHVLVVEDNAINRMLIASYLDEFGLSHEMVGSGASALLSLASKRYDLVLMDVAMPDLDGVEATKRIRALHAPAADVPIVALVSAKKGDRGAYLSAGMNAYVSKPIRGRELYRVLAPFLAKDAGEEPALRAG
jgi:signal transduction histidine kinase/ActR/RegA family two-component response regulator